MLQVNNVISEGSAAASITSPSLLFASAAALWKGYTFMTKRLWETTMLRHGGKHEEVALVPRSAGERLTESLQEQSRLNRFSLNKWKARRLSVLFKGQEQL